MARRPPGVTRTSRLLAVAAVALLAIGSSALAAAALQHGNPDTPSGTPAPAPTSDLGAESGVPETPATVSPAPAPIADAPRADERFLSVGSGGMWRATAGECGVTPPLVERSTDGGHTWTDVTPLYRGIGQVRGLDTFAGTEAEMLAHMGDACDLELLRTFTQGRFWEPYPDVLPNATYLSPVDRGVVVTPDGEIDAPCDDAWGLRTSADLVALICEGIAYRLIDDEWTSLTDASAVALAIFDDAVVVAHSDAACPQLAVSRLGAEPALAGCVDAADRTAAALAVSGDGLLAWSGDRLIVVG
ncbi:MULTISPECIES: hypothetical protein [unclassified Microbacterium]|uniref:hypothetical protein n=1 Tax=unclassified Microbacterium TaxID=2609290 RepID=UPI00214C5749|nr:MULTISPECIES: hypothetical protein [unclassified Microbacterium]MCR2784963.1 hypothetical protein [Microbacterium sp. zg.B96]WIM16502.1 hypothetical protein QNO11_02360 [Microbacterium sp. zg-B96]